MARTLTLGGDNTAGGVVTAPDGASGPGAKLSLLDGAPYACRGGKDLERRRTAGPDARRAVHVVCLPGADARRLRDRGPARLRRARSHGLHRPGEPGRRRDPQAHGLPPAPGAGGARAQPAADPARVGPGTVGEDTPVPGAGRA